MSATKRSGIGGIGAVERKLFEAGRAST